MGMSHSCDIVKWLRRNNLRKLVAHRRRACRENLLHKEKVVGSRRLTFHYGKVHLILLPLIIEIYYKVKRWMKRKNRSTMWIVGSKFLWKYTVQKNNSYSNVFVSIFQYANLKEVKVFQTTYYACCIAYFHFAKAYPREPWQDRAIPRFLGKPFHFITSNRSNRKVKKKSQNDYCKRASSTE